MSLDRYEERMNERRSRRSGRHASSERTLRDIAQWEARRDEVRRVLRHNLSVSRRRVATQQVLVLLACVVGLLLLLALAYHVFSQ